ALFDLTHGGTQRYKNVIHRMLTIFW
ncbi:hypothetical protein ATR1_365c0001, partial [Acetobacter tropicalis]